MIKKVNCSLILLHEFQKESEFAKQILTGSRNRVKRNEVEQNVLAEILKFFK